MPCRCFATASTVTRSTSRGKSSARYAITDRIEVLPLSPARQCARSCSLGIARPLFQGDLSGNPFPLKQSRDDSDLLLNVLARATAASRPIGVQRLDFFADKHRLFRRRRPRRDAQSNLVRSFPLVERFSMQRSAADQVDPHLREFIAQALANDLAGEVGAAQCIGAAVTDFTLTHVSRMVADADLELLRAPLAARPAHLDAARARLAQGHGGKVSDDVR